MKFIKKAINWFTDNRFFGPFLRRLLWIFKRRAFWVVITSLVGILLGISVLYLSYTADPPKNTKSFWEWILGTLKDHPTIILFISSLLTAFVLWLFRNHDIVMGLDLNMYHEAVRNIHDKQASVGLRQVAFKTLMELKEKSAWKEKIRGQVFPEANLRGLDLTSTDLSKIILNRADIKEADLTNANLINAELRNADLTNTKLNNVNLNLANLANAVLNNKNLTNVNLREANLAEAHLKGNYYYENEEAEEKNEKTPVTKKWLREDQKALNANSIKGIVEDTDLTRANLQGTDLGGYCLCKVILTNANLTQTNLTRAELMKANLMEANLSQANLTQAILENANLMEANLKGAHYYDGGEIAVTKKWLREREAKNVDSIKGILEDTDLTGKNLQGADLQGYCLCKVILTNANLTQTNLTQTNLKRANLTYANLTEANLTSANLTGADLTRANLTGANLTNTNLTGANLTSANLTRANLTGAYYYKDAERTPVTKKWLRAQGAFNVDTVTGIPWE